MGMFGMAIIFLIGGTGITHLIKNINNPDWIVALRNISPFIGENAQTAIILACILIGVITILLPLKLKYNEIHSPSHVDGLEVIGTGASLIIIAFFTSVLFAIIFLR